MFDWIIPLLTLTAMEVVLGIDNIIFISLVAARLPGGQHQSFPAAVDTFYHLRAGRHDGKAMTVRPGYTGHEDADRPNRPPVEEKKKVVWDLDD
jgi:hypothetical protein